MTNKAGRDRARVLHEAAALVDSEGLEGLALGTLAERLARAAVGKARDEAIIALARAFRAFIKEHPGLYALTVRSALLADAADSDMQQAQAEVLSVMTAVMAAYNLGGDDAIHAIRGLRSIGHGFATLEAAGGFGIAVDLDESYQRLVRMYLAGLGPVG